jgi:hypothetical protein
MKNKDFKIYKEGHLEGYKIGLRDMANYERRFKLEEYKNRTIFLLVSITGIGNILYFIFYHHHNVYVRLSFHLISFLLFFVYLYFLGKDYILDKNKNPVCLEKLSKQNGRK